MSIVLNEVEWVENMLSSRQLGKKPVETISRVARYFVQVEGYSKVEARSRLEEFMVQCDPSLILVKWSDTLDRVVKQGNKYPLIQIEGVSITERELAVVKGLDGVQLQRLAFTLLCISKYWNHVRPTNHGWVNTSDKEIMCMANINTSVQRQSLMFHKMKGQELLNFGRRVDSLSIQVSYADLEGVPVYTVMDFRNLGNQYMNLVKGGYFQCAHCGLTEKKKCNAQKYCNHCVGEAYGKKGA